MADSKRETVLKAIETSLEATAVERSGTTPSTIDSYGAANYTASNSIYDGHAQQKRGFVVEFAATQFVTSVQLYLAKAGSPTGNATLEIFEADTTDGGGLQVPSGTTALASGTLDVSTLSGSIALVEISIDTSVLMEAGWYAVTLEYEGGDASNRVDIGYDFDAPTHDGHGISYARATGSWVGSSTKDAIFVLSGKTVVSKPTGLGVYRQPEAEWDDSTLPRIDFWIANEVVVGEITQGQTKVLTVDVRAIVKWTADDGGSGDEALDPYLTWIELALLSDETLDGNANLCEYTGMRTPEVAKRGDRYAGAIMTFDVTYQTVFGDPGTGIG